MLNTKFVITDIAHPGLRDVKDNCPECLALAHDAVLSATLTGSRGATYGEVSADGTTRHLVTVTRALVV